MSRSALKHAVEQVKTGSPASVRKAKKDIEQLFHQALKSPQRRDLAHFTLVIDELPNFDSLPDSDHQAWFVDILKWAVMAVGEMHGDTFSRFLLMTIQHPSGKVRQSALRSAFWLVIALTQPVDEERLTAREKRRAQENVEQFCKLIYEAEQLLEKHHEPRFNRYTYIQSMPASVYKSLQKLLTEELVRGPYYEQLYHDYLKQQGLTSANHRPPSGSDDIDPFMSLLHLSFMPDAENLALQQRTITERLSRLLQTTGSTHSATDIIKIIYHEDGNEFSALLNVFGPNVDDTLLRNIVVALQDAWNFFPHKSLQGRAPVEVLAEYEIEQHDKDNGS